MDALNRLEAEEIAEGRIKAPDWVVAKCLSSWMEIVKRKQDVSNVVVMLSRRYPRFRIYEVVKPLLN